MSKTEQRLEQLCLDQPKFLKRGGLCVALVVTKAALENGLPLHSEKLRTQEGGQVMGLGKAAVQKILRVHGITKVLAEEGGRTSRGTLGLMKDYVEALNELHEAGEANLAEAEQWWIGKVRLHFASQGPRFHFDEGKSLRANIEDLLKQAAELQSHSGGTNYLGAMLQHLVGAKLDLVLGEGKVTHHGSSVADHSTNRGCDFHIDQAAIHVTTSPSEALVRKCAENLNRNLRPLIVTVPDGMAGALYLLRNAGLQDRVDVLDCGQFMTANLYERSFFLSAEYLPTMRRLLERYNAIVSECETDPVLKVQLGENSED